MEVELVPLSQLNHAEIKKLAVLHHSVMHTLLSELGLSMVLRYYRIAHSDTSVVGIAAINDSNELIGWAIGSPHPDRINSRLRTPLLWFAKQMFRVMFTRPRVLWQLISSVIFTSTQMELTNGAIELTYIGVGSGQRGKGLGRDLLSRFIETSREEGYQSIILSVETDNKPAIALYEKSGFKVIKTYSEGHYQRHRMELILE